MPAKGVEFQSLSDLVNSGNSGGNNYIELDPRKGTAKPKKKASKSSSKVPSRIFSSEKKDDESVIAETDPLSEQAPASKCCCFTWRRGR